MMNVTAAQHFVRAPDWTWFILFYFFFAGLAGGSYAIATLLRLYGNRSDEPMARLGYYAAFPAYVMCPILLTVDLWQPQRFWHMLVNTTPGNEGLILKPWSPISVGTWAVLVFGLFVTVSFIEVLVRDRKIRTGFTDRAVRLLDGTPGKVWNAVGGLAGVFMASYTGVVLAVTNQPVWSDTWALGGLFLASGLSGATALLWWLARYRPDARASGGVFVLFERIFALLELALIVLFVLTLIPAGTLGQTFGFPWILLWLVAFAGLVPGLSGLVTQRLTVTPEGAVTAQSARVAVAAPWLILVGVLALRAAVLFSVQ
jgi:formate-dependent nitrite reductase membrane component NrfD